ncbi:MAG: SpoVA/SpoVAEb family sporulation membrane protein [Oscillospiraceae bacterium]|nr:SpoVA/SpoVAEb family sporulation membrane protein [Oscillospiraceae bacterium]
MNILFAILRAFLIGGAICVFVQLVLNFTKFSMARILVSLVVLGALLSALGLYAPLVEFAGAGATVPLSGFGHAMIEGTRQAIDEQGWVGILTGPFTAAAAGTGLAVICGLLASLVAKPREK